MVRPPISPETIHSADNGRFMSFDIDRTDRRFWWNCPACECTYQETLAVMTTRGEQATCPPCRTAANLLGSTGARHETGVPSTATTPKKDSGPPPLPSSVREAYEAARAITEEVWTSAGWTDLGDARDWSMLRLFDLDGLSEDELARVLRPIEQSTVSRGLVRDCCEARLRLSEVADLITAGVTSEEISRYAQWFRYGFQPDEIPAWECVSEPWECADWKRARFGPLDTYNWLADFHYPEDAALWRDRGIGPARAAWYRDAHISPEEAVTYEVRRAAGEDIRAEVAVMGGLRGGTIDMNQA